MPLAGCHTSFRLPWRCQLLLHTIEQAKRVCPLQGATPASGSPGGASSYCTRLSKPSGCAPCRVPHQLQAPRRCQLLLHTIEQAKRVCPLQGATPASGSPGGASSYCTRLSKPRGCAPCRVPHQLRAPLEVPAPIAHD